MRVHYALVHFGECQTQEKITNGHIGADQEHPLGFEVDLEDVGCFLIHFVNLLVLAASCFLVSESQQSELLNYRQQIRHDKLHPLYLMHLLFVVYAQKLFFVTGSYEHCANRERVA